MYRVQKTADRDPAHYPVVFVTFLVLAAAFAVWRTTVVNWEVWFGPVAWVAELFGLVTTVLFVVTMRGRVRVEPRTVSIPPGAAGTPSAGTVDVLVPTVNEPLSVLEATVLGAVNVRGVRQVLVLDDGVRDEVREMAGRLGARYVPRAGGADAKAGNLNHGLRATDADFVVVLDADHIPLPEFVEQTLGYFDDPGVGFVQSPQSFYNTESFTFRRRRGQDAGWHEQGMFYGGVQPTKDRTESAIYTGTSAMLRRTALDSIGGFATGTPTEDIHTSVRLHAHGWRSVYLETPLAYGLEVENLEEYYRTRRRWAMGSLQLLFRHPDSPLRARGLSLHQRLNYVSAMVVHLQGLNRLLYLVIPIAALTTGTAPVDGPYARYGFAFLAFTVLTIWTVVLFGRGHFHLLHTEVFGVTDSVPMLAGLRGLVGTEQEFQVTVKEAGRTSGGGLKSAYRVLAAVSLLGLALAVVRLVRGEYLAIAGWSAAFLAVSSAYVVAFLVATARYERRTVSPSYSRLGPAELYRHVLSLAAGARPPGPRASGARASGARRPGSPPFVPAHP